MALETASYIYQLNASNPAGSDRLQEGDDHIRLIKAALKATFPGIQGPLDASITHTLLNGLASAFLPSKSVILWLGTTTSIPSGWVNLDGSVVQLADGTSFTTPNMADFVPAGASSAHALMTTYGQASKTITTNAGGAHGHTASTSSAGSHSHSGTTGGTALTTDQIPAHTHYTFSDASGNTDTLSSFPEGAPNKNGTTSGGSSAPTYFMSGTGNQANIARSSSVGANAAHSHSIGSDGAHTHPVTVDGAADHTHAATIDVTQPTMAFYFIMKL